MPIASEQIERTLTQDDFDRFAELSGDINPIHVNPDFSAATRFGRTVAHGMLLSSIFRGLVAALAPNTRQLSQDIKFLAPTYADERHSFAAHIESHRGRRLTIAFCCTRLNDLTITCNGQTELATDGQSGCP